MDTYWLELIEVANASRCGPYLVCRQKDTVMAENISPPPSNYISRIVFVVMVSSCSECLFEHLVLTSPSIYLPTIDTVQIQYSIFLQSGSLPSSYIRHKVPVRDRGNNQPHSFLSELLISDAGVER